MSYPKAYYRLTTGEDIHDPHIQLDTTKLDYFHIPPFSIAPPGSELRFTEEKNLEQAYSKSFIAAPDPPRPLLKAEFFSSPERTYIFDGFYWNLPVTDSTLHQTGCGGRISVEESFHGLIREDEISKAFGCKTSSETKESAKRNESTTPKVNSNGLAKKSWIRYLSSGIGFKLSKKESGAEVKVEISDDGWEAINADDFVEEFILVGRTD